MKFIFPSSIAAYGLPDLDTKLAYTRVREWEWNNPRTLGAMQTAQPGPAAAEGEAKRLRLVGVPAFDVGTNYLPNDMLAMVHKGEAIIPAQRNLPGNNSSNVTNINVSVAMPQGGSRATAMQFGTDAARQIGRANSRNG